ncbi:MAG: ZIP family metal transporter [Burkholderiales bacterium]|nr:MAG: ZIP family metal transporter [Betaproteobacteria bacterium]TAG28896.1 MAG: ZIP family metal transporter [Burkholderiales bacterium]TAG46143.1 MAG: ZIP family metal transporter [Betaproteobacteria bacterium]
MLLWIIAACAVGGVASVIIASVLVFRCKAHWVGRLIAFAAGTMLASALLDILPEAIAASKGNYQGVTITLFVGVLAFYFLERAAIWRHAHTSHSSSEGDLGGAPWVILLGDGVHNFVDGVLIAAAFLVDPWVGVTTAFAVAAHELPQELGDTVLLLSAGWSKKKVVFANAMSGLACVVGGIVGYFALAGLQSALPYVLTIAAASFIYIAMVDLLPLLHRRHRIDGFLAQSGLLAAGVVCVAVIGELLHHHH